MSESNYGQDNQASLVVPEDDFERVIKEAHHEAEAFGIPLVVYRNSTRDGAYLFVDPNGDATAIVKGEEYIIGNLLTNSTVVYNDWKRWVNIERCNANIISTYPDLLTERSA